MKGFLVMDNIQDPQESSVLTFWENKEDIDAFIIQTAKYYRI